MVVRFFMLSLAALVGDQVSKVWAVGRLTGVAEDGMPRLGVAAQLQRFWQVKHPSGRFTIAVVDDFWHFRYLENPGAAWGFLSTAPAWFRGPFFVSVSLLAMLLIVLYYRSLRSEQILLRSALALVFGGAVGNFIDRIRLGYVVDFIDWHWYSGPHWPTFNIADSCICVGVMLMVLDMVVNKESYQ